MLLQWIAEKRALTDPTSLQAFLCHLEMLLSDGEAEEFGIFMYTSKQKRPN
jgi:hypothetical protein